MAEDQTEPTPIELCLLNVTMFLGFDMTNMTQRESDLLLHTTRNMCSHLLNNEDSYINALISYYIMGIGGMTMCCLGLIGNIISLVVLSQKAMRSSTYSYLAALAVCDLCVLTCSIIIITKDLTKPVQGQQQWPYGDIYPYLFPVIHPAAFMFQVTSVWLTLAFTVDRYIMICHPFDAEPLCTISRARKVIAGLFVGSTLFNLPKFFEYETINVLVNPQNNITKVGYDLTNLGNSHIFRELYHSWFYIVFVCGVPFVSLAVLNAFLIHAVTQSRRRGREINAAERKRNDTTVMLISVVIVFFICQMPALVSRVIWAFHEDPKESAKKTPLYALNEVGNFLIITNSAINIVPYYFFGRRFRRQFWRIFCRCLLKYKRFQELTRSFSLTVAEPMRKESNGSLHNTKITTVPPPSYTSDMNGRVPAGEAVQMKNLANSTSYDVNRKTSVMSTASDCCYDKHERTKGRKEKKALKSDCGSGMPVNNTPMPPTAEEVNGNCQTTAATDPALDCLLDDTHNND